MEEDKMPKQTVSLDIGYSSKKEGKSNAILLKLRKGENGMGCLTSRGVTSKTTRRNETNHG